MHNVMKLLSAFWQPQACEREGGAEGLVGKAEEDPPGGRGDLLDGHGDVLCGQDDVLDGHDAVLDVHDDFGIGIESQKCPF